MLLAFMLCAGCSKTENQKLRDLDYAILSEEVLPTDLRELIDSKKEQPFEFTYSDHDRMYICIGYGKQDKGGYSIVLDDLYLTNEAVYIHTTLLGPDPGKQNKKTAAYPYIVIQTEQVEQPVIFE